LFDNLQFIADFIEPNCDHEVSKAMLILVVEDQHHIRFMLSALLRKLGYDVIEAHDGLEAWDFVQYRQHIDLIITDIWMPGIDGIELLKAVKALKPHITFIMLTAYLDRKEIALQEGAAHFIAKPFDAAELIQVVKTCLNAPRS
jgi:CheY-like chemotaxis protein